MLITRLDVKLGLVKSIQVTRDLEFACYTTPNIQLSTINLYTTIILHTAPFWLPRTLQSKNIIPQLPVWDLNDYLKYRI